MRRLQLWPREPQAIAGRTTLYLTTTKKNLLSLFMLPKSPGLNLHRSEVFHGATRSRDCMLLSGVLFIDHSRRYWTADNGNGARFLLVSPFHSPPQQIIDIAYYYYCPLDIAKGGLDRQQYRTTRTGYQCKRKTRFRFQAQASSQKVATQLPESSYHLLR
jgi:hypothetical protein